MCELTLSVSRVLVNSQHASAECEDMCQGQIIAIVTNQICLASQPCAIFRGVNKLQCNDLWLNYFKTNHLEKHSRAIPHD